MRVPQWLTLVVAALVIFFGLYRLRVAARSAEEDRRATARKGLWALPRRTHALIGIIYLILGGALIATSFGWNPMAGVFGGKPAPEAPKAVPARPDGVRVETP